MRIRSSFLSAAALIVFACGCGDDPLIEPGLDASVTDAEAGGSDAGLDAGAVDSGVTVFGCRITDEPIVGGGAGGGPMQGETIVHVLAAEDDSPLAEVSVLITKDGRSWEGSTKLNGCVRFVDPELSGPVTLSVFKTARVFSTIAGHDAARVTVRMGPLSGVVPRQARATISGLVNGWDVLTTTTATIARFAAAGAIRRSVFGGDLSQANRPNSNVGSNVAVIGAGSFNFDNYRLVVDPTQTVGVWLGAGFVEFPTVGDPIFHDTHIGILTGIELQDRDEINDADVEISLPRDQRLSASFGRVPAELPSILMGGFIELPLFGGVFFTGLESPANAREDFISPTLTGPLAGAGYGAVVQATSEDGRRASLLIRHGSPSTSVDFGDLLPLPGLSVVGRTVSATISDRTDDIGFLQFATETQLLWVVQLNDPSGLNPSVVMPEVPAGLSDPLTGQVFVSGSFQSFAVPFDPNNLRNADVNTDASIEALTRNRIEHNF